MLMMNGDRVIYLTNSLKLYFLSFEGISHLNDLFDVLQNDYSTSSLDEIITLYALKHGVFQYSSFI